MAATAATAAVAPAARDYSELELATAIRLGRAVRIDAITPDVARRGTAPSGWPLLCLAALHDRPLVALRLVQLGARVDDGPTVTNGATATYIAAQCGHTRVLSVLVGAGADVNLCNERGASPLFVATQNDHAAAADMLLCHGADPHAATDLGWTALHIAARQGHADAVDRLLTRAQVHVNARTKSRLTALHIAAHWDRADVARRLLLAGIDAQATDSLGRTALDVAEAAPARRARRH